MTKAHLSVKSAGANLPLKALQPNNKPRFLADAMLGNIARKLRAFGFDTLYMAHTHDDEILRVGIAEERTILTADRELFRRIVGLNATGVLVDCRSELDDIVHILSKAGVVSVSFGADTQTTNGIIESRCSACNGLLKTSSSGEIEGLVPEAVAAHHNQFYQCQACKKVYWKGGHFKRLQLLSKRISSILQSRTNPTKLEC